MPKKPKRTEPRHRSSLAVAELTGEELGELADRMVEAETEAEAEALSEEIVRGFYGTKNPPREGGPLAHQDEFTVRSEIASERRHSIEIDQVYGEIELTQQSPLQAEELSSGQP